MKLSIKLIVLACFAGSIVAVHAQNVGIGTSTPISKLHVSTSAVADGLMIDNVAANGDPIVVFSLNGVATHSMGVDDSDADKFKIGTSAITTNTRLTIQTNGYIGIGITAPLYDFQVVKSRSNDYVAYFQNLADNGASLAGYSEGSFNAIAGITNNATGLGAYGVHLPTAGAGLGVWGTSNSSDAIGVQGSIPTTGSWLGYGGLFTGGLGYANGLYNLSDARTKKNIATLDNALNKVQQLRGVSFQYNEEYARFHGGDNRTYTGFIAQEVELVVPEAVAEKYIVNTGAGSNGPLADMQQAERTTVKVVDYVSLVPLLVEAIKEQQKTIMELQQRVNELEKGN